MRTPSWAGFALIFACLLPLPLRAGPASSTTQVFVFGDDYSDTGRCLATIGVPRPPNWHGRFSNGPVAVERMASTLGVDLAGTNYAVCGALTAGRSLYLYFPGMDAQIADFLSAAPSFDSTSAVFLLWGGHNDVRNWGADATTVAAAAAALATHVQTLYAAGARRFVVANLLDLSLTPAAVSAGPASQAALRSLVTTFNTSLDNALVTVASLPGIDLARVDMFGFYARFVADPGTYGLANVVDPCFSGISIVCSDPSKYLFWESQHPTTVIHQILGNELAAAVLKRTPIADPRALTGLWYDPASSGQGIELHWVEPGRLVVLFYGHHDDGENLFLVGTHDGPIAYGDAFTLPLTITHGGRFNHLDPAQIVRETWGNVQLRFDSCTSAEARLTGTDGAQTLALVPLTRVPGLSCD